ncbi:MAG: CBS domain-containing protein, partial [Planctomycetes bacterium]|nr:CBS domain-containing protein [Planctomycetota bacterium]
AADTFSGSVGLAVIMIVTATTFVVQIIGPPCVKLAAKRAGEVGLKVTEQDLMESYTVGEMVDGTVPVIKERTPLSEIIRIVGETDAMSYPVVAETGELVGVITLEDLRRSFGDEELANVLVAYDLMESPPDAVTQDVPLAEGMSKMQEQRLNYLPVVAAEDARFIGLLDERIVRRRLSEEVIRRQRQADAAGEAGGEAAGGPQRAT